MDVNVLESIIAFDALTQNMDRQREVPNLMCFGSRVFPIDHERCFSFLSSGVEFPWPTFVQNHVLRPYVNLHNERFGADLNWAMDALTEDWLRSLDLTLPTEFVQNQSDLKQILDYLGEVSRNRPAFFASLLETLKFIR